MPHCSFFCLYVSLPAITTSRLHLKLALEYFADILSQIDRLIESPAGGGGIDILRRFGPSCFSHL